MLRGSIILVLIVGLCASGATLASSRYDMDDGSFIGRVSNYAAIGLHSVLGTKDRFNDIAAAIRNAVSRDDD